MRDTNNLRCSITVEMNEPAAGLEENEQLTSFRPVLAVHNRQLGEDAHLGKVSR